MPRISLTQFVDIIFASPSNKRKTIQDIKHKNQSYGYYEPFRKAVFSYHYGRGNIEVIAKCDQKATMRAQDKHLRACSDSYLEWLRKTNPKILQLPPKVDVPLGKLVVKVSCELACEYSGKQRFIKLHWKDKSPGQDQHVLVSAIMMMAFPEYVAGKVSMQLLQLRPEPKLHLASRSLEKHQEVLLHEARSIIDWWERV